MIIQVPPHVERILRDRAEEYACHLPEGMDDLEYLGSEEREMWPS